LRPFGSAVSLLNLHGQQKESAYPGATRDIQGDPPETEETTLRLLFWR
jgi:hypothetical protein